MKEIVFIRQNAEKWKHFEDIVRLRTKRDPDTLARLFIELTDDLSYARTFYPRSVVTRYLNSITARFHQEIIKNKKEQRRRIAAFWTQEQPALIRLHWKEMIVSLSVFVVGAIIGILSSAFDDGFVRLVLGDSYVKVTLENIHKGDPMAVYKSMNNVDMFLGVTINNLMVAMVAFALGTLFSVGSGYIIFTNGVMLGAFHHFFYTKGLLLTCVASVWIHGAMEIPAVIIAGGAGIVVGNSILFPGTYTRTASFMRGAREGLAILVGVVPFFVVAGVLEGFVTRYSGMPRLLSAAIIALSCMVVIGYYVIYPIMFSKTVRERSV